MKGRGATSGRDRVMVECFNSLNPIEDQHVLQALLMLSTDLLLDVLSQPEFSAVLFYFIFFYTSTTKYIILADNFQKHLSTLCNMDDPQNTLLTKILGLVDSSDITSLCTTLQER